jgi:hypothetical protein
MSQSALATVQGIKESLAKEVEKGDDLSEESCRDMLEQLDKCNMTMGVLTKSLIGTVVSKLKRHDQLGPLAKGLVKKWKKVAKDAEAAKQTKSERRASNASSQGSATAEAAAVDAEEWADLSPQRQTMCQKFHKFLGVHRKALVKSGINAEAVDHLLVSRASEIEGAITEKFANEKSGYADKARSLCFNLKKNQQLAESVILGQVSAEELVGMTSEQLASAEARKAREENAKKLIDSKRLDWEQANEGNCMIRHWVWWIKINERLSQGRRMSCQMGAHQFALPASLPIFIDACTRTNLIPFFSCYFLHFFLAGTAIFVCR